MKRVLLTVVFVLSLLIMFGGCESDGHRGQRWDQDRHSDRSDQDRDSESRHDEERH